MTFPRFHRLVAACAAASVASFTWLSASEARSSAPRIAIAGISYGMSPAEVRVVLGSPLHIHKELQSGQVFGEVWQYQDRLEIELQKPFIAPGRSGPLRVRFVTTKSPLDKTSTGLHVGSALATVKRLRNIFCGDYGTDVYLCQWAVNKSNGPCGPHLYFDFHRSGERVHGSVFQIELTANNGEGCYGPNAYKP